ncbi:MAG: phasin family protein [Pseudomonadota bacterium]
MKTPSLNKTIDQVNSAIKELRESGLAMVTQLRSNGTSLFAELVQEGEAVQSRAVAAVTTPVTKLRQELGSRVQLAPKVDQAREVVSDNVQRLENVVQEQLGKVLDFAGLPSQAELDRLNTRLASLRREVTRLKRAA